jgi:hypothetical protein
MTKQDQSGLQIDPIHTGAICQEFGERLRADLKQNPSRLPPGILGLMERFDSVDGEPEAMKSSTGMDVR